MDHALQRVLPETSLMKKSAGGGKQEIAAIPPVYIVDDNFDDRQAGALIMRDAGRSAETFSGGESFLEALDMLRPGCVVLDVRMPGLDGLAVLRELTLKRPDWPVVMMSGQADVACAVEAMKRGARDFVEKPCLAPELLDAIDRAFAAMGGKPEKAAAAQKLMQIITPREMDVLKLLLVGQQNKAIAFDLRISERTVEVHRARLMRRLGVRSFAELIRKAVEHGLGAERA